MVTNITRLLVSKFWKILWLYKNISLRIMLSRNPTKMEFLEFEGPLWLKDFS